MKKGKKLLSVLLAFMLTLTAFAGNFSVEAAGNTTKYTNAAEIAQYVSDGYNGGVKGPITIT